MSNLHQRRSLAANSILRPFWFCCSLLITSASAFVSGQPAVMSTFPPTTPTPTSLSVLPADPATFTQASINFFNGCRLPASLIAGSSVAAIFSLMNQASKNAYTHDSSLTRLEWITLRLYHAIAIMSFNLSMTAIITTTTASTTLLLGRLDPAPYTDVYHFMRGEMGLEFVLTRISFLSSVLFFWTGVGFRLMLELQLLRPGRRRGALLLGLTMFGFLAGNMSKIHDTLNCWPNLFMMFMELAQMLYQRAVQHRGPLHILSMISLTSATVLAVHSFVSLLFANDKDHRKDEVRSDIGKRGQLS